MARDERLGLPRDLGGGLTLRWSRPDDEEALAEFNRWIHAWPGSEPDEVAALMTKELLSPSHPTTSPGDHVLVEEATSGKIVSSICLIPQTWSYAGISFGVARPELVGTDPAFRDRGLVRAQMDVLHELSVERGDLIQAITGIPYFYRQFGYEPALITTQSRYGAPLAAQQSEVPPYHIRPATEIDIPAIMACYDIAARRMLMAVVRDEAQWRWEISGRLAGSDYVQMLWIICSRDGSPAGFLSCIESFDSQRSVLWATVCELLEGESWPIAAPIITEHLRQEASKEAAKAGSSVANIGFDWGYDHPYAQLQKRVFQTPVRPFGWLIRIPDLACFINHIKPALDERLRSSPFERHSGELVLTFFRSGLKFAFEDGRIKTVKNFKPESHRAAAAGFPDLTFYYLLLGSRTIEELEYAFPDCFVRKPIDRALLETLFPKKPSAIWPV
jgi:hypothetical protein